MTQSLLGRPHKARGDGEASPDSGEIANAFTECILGVYRARREAKNKKTPAGRTKAAALNSANRKQGRVTAVATWVYLCLS